MATMCKYRLNRKGTQEKQICMSTGVVAKLVWCTLGGAFKNICNVLYIVYFGVLPLIDEQVWWWPLIPVAKGLTPTSPPHHPLGNFVEATPKSSKDFLIVIIRFIP